MSEKDDGGFIYPVGGAYTDNYRGITRRDWLAGLAMQGLIAKEDRMQSSDFLVEHSYFLADALIEEGKK